MGDNYAEFCKSAEKSRARNGGGLTFFHYRKKLRYDSEGTYSYGSKIAHVDLEQKTSQKIGHLSFMSNKHYNYAVYVFNICYDFHEVLCPCEQLIHIQHLSYDDHT